MFSIQGGIEMGKSKVILAIGILTLTLVTGCSNGGIRSGAVNLKGIEQTQKEEQLYNVAFEKYAADEKLGVILSTPDDEVLASITGLERYVHYANSEKLLVLPKYNGATVEVKKLGFDGEKLVEEETLYSKQHSTDDYGLLVEAFRPEGLPELLIRVSYQEKIATYIVAENGKEGTPSLFYLKEEKEEESLGLGEVIVPIEGDVTAGYYLHHVDEVDIDQDGRSESLEVYSTATVDEAGNLLMDDGNDWKLVVRKGNKQYLIVDDFIQLGKLEYKTYEEYGDERVFHLLITKAQGAGLTMYDCYYDGEQDAFISQVVYETKGNIGFGVDY